MTAELINHQLQYFMSNIMLIFNIIHLLLEYMSIVQDTSHVMPIINRGSGIFSIYSLLLIFRKNNDYIQFLAETNLKKLENWIVIPRVHLTFHLYSWYSCLVLNLNKTKNNQHIKHLVCINKDAEFYSLPTN